MAQTERGSDIPSAEAIAAAEAAQIFNADSNKVTLKDILEETDNTLLVFIRHFACGQCQSYVSALTESIKPEELAAANASIKIIACGQPSLIKSYATGLACAFPIYADPNQTVYKALELGRSLNAGDKKPDYLKNVNTVASVFKSIWWALSNGPLQTGDFSQNGGEFLVTKDGQWKWGSRMKNTRDHTEIAELREVLGLKEEEKKDEAKPVEPVAAAS